MSMPRIIRAAVVLVLVGCSTGCAYLYRADDDAAAKEAIKNYQDANFTKALDAERAALATQQSERHDLVKRSQVALRDASIARAIGGAQGFTWEAVSTWIDARTSYIAGGDAKPLPPGCSPLLRDAKNDLSFAQDKMQLAADKVALRLKVLGLTASPSCKPPTQLPTADIEAVGLAERFRLACVDFAAKQECVSATTESGNGMVKRLGDQLAKIDEDDRAISNEIDRLTGLYSKAMTEADAAKPTEGAAAAIADKLQAQLDAIETKVNDKVDELKARLPSMLREKATLKKVALQKEVIEAYIAALRGESPTVGSVSQHRAFLVADLVNKATGKPAPPTAGVLLQAEVLRLRINAAQARIDRGEQKRNLFQQRIDFLTDELGFLQEAGQQLKDAQAAKCRAQPLAAGFGKQGKPSACAVIASKLLLAFDSSWTFGRLPFEQAEYEAIDLDERAALEESQAAILGSDAVVRAALDQVARLYASGIKSEDIWGLWQSLGLTGIAVRIK
jgi:hypothetical protein